MASPVEQYTREIRDSLDYWATWTPDRPLALGDCGPIEDRRFYPESDIGNIGVTFEVLSDDSAADLQHISRGAVEISFQAEGESRDLPNIPEGKAGVSAKFSRENATVFVARDCCQERIDDLPAVKRALIEKAKRQDFPADEYAIVTNLVIAGSTTVLISQDRESEFAATAESNFSAGILDIANASLGLNRTYERSLQTSIVSEAGMHPLFQGIRMETKFLRGAGIDPLDVEGDDHDSPFSELTIAAVAE